MGARKIWSAEEKMAAVLEGFKGRSIREICTEYGISDVQYYKWRNQALESMQEGLKDKRRKGNMSAEAERNRLFRIIGEQQTIIEIQKKISATL